MALAATPIELVKVQLQMQLLPTSASSASSLISSSVSNRIASSSSSSVVASASAATSKSATYVSPLGFARQIYHHRGIRGFWYGVTATMSQRMWFGLFFLSYDVMMQWARVPMRHKGGHVGPRVKEGTANFVAGGMASSECPGFYLTAKPDSL